MKEIRGFLVVLVLVLFFSLIATIAQTPAPNAPIATGSIKVPDEVGVKIRDVQLDETKLENQLLQLSQQYQADQKKIENDEKRLVELKAEALKAANLEAESDQWDVDIDKLQIMAKPKPAEKK